MLVPVIPASDLTCPVCEVDWMRAALGPNCWGCDQPGVPGHVMPAIFSYGDPYVAHGDDM